MLQPRPYPSSSPPLRKLQHLEDQARWLGGEEDFYRAPLTTFFEDGNNNVGVPMKANKLSGQECTGLNDGSKNSVATTYLADAWNWGAEIFCGCDVRFVERNHEDGGYVVYFSLHGNGREMFPDEHQSQLFWVKAVSFMT